MTDAEFLDYCESHASTPRCGFVPEQLSRLSRLAGWTDHWVDEPRRVVDCDRDVVLSCVSAARQRIAGAS